MFKRILQVTIDWLFPLRRRGAGGGDDPVRARSRVLDCAELEDRVLMSASPVSVVVVPDSDVDPKPVVQAVDPGESVVATLDKALALLASADEPGGVANLDAPNRFLAAAAAADQSTAAPAMEMHEIVFVDPSVPDYQPTVEAILHRDEWARELSVVLLDSGRDGVEQISEVLAQYDNLNALHVVTHGAGGAVALGSATLSLDNVGVYGGDLVHWRDALASGAELRFYGGDLPQHEDGRTLLESLSALTGAATTATAVGTAAHGAGVVLIDAHLEDSGILAQAVEPGAQLFMYDSSRESAHDVLASVANWAETTGSKIESLSILSHGRWDAFDLGSQWISSGSLDQTAADWQRLGAVFSAGANIEIFGCNVAAPGSSGQLLLDRLAVLTGADVFASDDITGYGGDWLLEAASAGDLAELTLGLSAPLNFGSWRPTTWPSRVRPSR